mmetsp:Transcript_3424/g.12661  ORF Transcript_3424/g.12661 Transcript_3424/m.12661 type:complete len:200 (-) Transcript_3424:87-686(-)
MLTMASPVVVVRKLTWNSFLRRVSLCRISVTTFFISSLIFSLPMGNVSTCTGIRGSSLSNIARKESSPSCHTRNSARIRKCDLRDSKTSVRGNSISVLCFSPGFFSVEQTDPPAKCARAKSIFKSSSSRYVSGRTATSSLARVSCHCQPVRPWPLGRFDRVGAKNVRLGLPAAAELHNLPLTDPTKNREVDTRKVAARA